VKLSIPLKLTELVLVLRVLLMPPIIIDWFENVKVTNCELIIVEQLDLHIPLPTPPIMSAKQAFGPEIE
jgi:hypothetical protein